MDRAENTDLDDNTVTEKHKFSGEKPGGSPERWSQVEN